MDSACSLIFVPVIVEIAKYLFNMNNFVAFIKGYASTYKEPFFPFSSGQFLYTGKG